MTSRTTPGIDEIFFAALERESPEARAAYLDEVCGSDNELRHRVERLLDAQPKVGSFLAAPAVGPTVTIPSSGEREGPGTIIGPYRLLESIGEGGMGVVYMAEQSQPVRRKVALKIIKPGMDTRQVIARFEAERQALAMMDHPHIARVFDGGMTESGRPYFVMELVRGVPITEYCDRNRLPIAERLRLFAQVCQAVQHAHQKGIIHRDIKPSNVLVTSLDGVAWPKVIDFGVAKATGQSLTEKTLFTGFAQLIGTPLYMSPEQAEMSAVDVDTRSDIYSLGVLLYELLTGTTPFDQVTFKTAALDEVRRIIREQEPPKPSTRLSALGATLTTVSGNRRTDPRTLDRSLRGELDWIVMKALEKDRRRRYETANGLARDVERFLAGEPVEAGAPSAWYRFRKFAHRNRVVLAATLLIALALIAGTVVSTWQAIVARRARAVSVAQRDRAERAEADALAQRDRAEQNYRMARGAVDKLLTEVGQVSLKDVPQMEPVRRKLLESALRYYQDLLRQRGEDASIRHEVGRAYERVAEIQQLLGRLNQAREAGRSAVDVLEQLVTEYPAVAAYRSSLGAALSRVGLIATEVGAIPEAEQAHRRAVDFLTSLASDPEVSGQDRRLLGAAHNRFGLLFFRAGRLPEAENQFRQALAIEEQLATEQPDDAELRSRLGGVLSNLAVIHNQRKGTPAEARRLLERAIAHQEAALKADPKDRMRRQFLQNHHINLFDTLDQLGDLPAALETGRRSLVLSRELARDFPEVADYRDSVAGAYLNLGRILRKLGKDAESEQFYRRSLEHFEALVTDSPAVPVYRQYTATCLWDLAAFLEKQGRFSEALPALRRAHDLYRQLAGETPQATMYRTKLGDVRSALLWLLMIGLGPAHGDAAEAARLAEEAIAQEPTRSRSHVMLAATRYRSGDFAGAVAAMKRSLELEPREDGSLLWLAMAYGRLGDADRAHSLYDRTATWIDANEPKDPFLARLRAEAASLLRVPERTRTVGRKEANAKTRSNP